MVVSYPGHSLREGSYSSAEMQQAYATAPANWAGVCAPARARVCVFQDNPALKKSCYFEKKIKDEKLDPFYRDK